MNLQYEALYHQLEEQHWWFQARRDIVFDQIKHLNLPKDARILEIGCSGGPLQQRLRDTGYHEVSGIDISETAIALAQQRGIPNVAVMDGIKLEFADSSFDLVVASDVLEHIQNEEQALNEWQRVLKPNGQLLVYVPAHPSLWSRHDVANHHFRRYTAASLSQALRKAGYQLTRSSYWNFWLFFPTWLLRRWQRPSASPDMSGDLIRLPAVLNQSLFRLVQAENRWLRRFNLPTGVSVFALASKPA
ncbi:class I SAM-dependent methyltransferase [Microvirga sp. STR05]|uniref:Class I SAM-dependent methyltransferase n=1 Tax=Hymenobacter duratus TaxID=2771356 RepID=A0ABR8JAL5_9BACT|nr:class I SAM-dependent methyltransferase [Hymenobacter duratus]MBD2713632.1 class I SAM-dependent methyltransferase [Hymenobacter duratus]MBR7948534.1 class I SAM-dependent methyltransferase [Microvirga sp. STR05]